MYRTNPYLDLHTAYNARSAWGWARPRHRTIAREMGEEAGALPLVLHDKLTRTNPTRAQDSEFGHVRSEGNRREDGQVTSHSHSPPARQAVGLV
ncbi:hypothetical protein IAQ61_007148 [Plenodomus lingam]|uniref:uncharacterized protein n=1 Tax=Leptosphaeria maculans TaxID=5022 RepID=UPI0033323F10|nr:hypothetical protein IAQ61_007148 [Plenodomus lingam]